MKTINTMNTVNETVNNKKTNSVLSQEIEKNIMSAADVINMSPEEIQGYKNFTELGNLLKVSKTAIGLINKLDYKNSKKTPTEQLLSMFGIPENTENKKTLTIQDAINSAYQKNENEYTGNLIAA